MRAISISCLRAYPETKFDQPLFSLVDLDPKLAAELCSHASIVKRVLLAVVELDSGWAGGPPRAVEINEGTFVRARERQSLI